MGALLRRSSVCCVGRRLGTFARGHSDRESYQVHPSEKQVVRLLEYRLPTEAESALAEWSMLLDGRHSLYKGITTDYKSVIQSFLLKFHSEILRNAVSVNAGISVNKGFDIEANFHSFDFRRASIVAISRFTTFDKKQKHGQDGFVFLKLRPGKNVGCPCGLP
ncbi:unnamed protein product [Effrenium voratum]|nr:unnamed protein product [Effrenium voratum]